MYKLLTSLLFVLSSCSLADIVSTDIRSDTITVGNTGLHTLDSNASHDLITRCGSDLSEDRTLSWYPGDANRNFTIEADSSINQDVTTDATPTFATVSASASFLGTGANIGWTVVSGADTACETTCDEPACVFGWDAGTSAIVACDNAIADTCVCAGVNTPH